MLGTGFGAQFVLNLGPQVWQGFQSRRVFHRIPAAHSPTGRELKLRHWHLNDAYLALMQAEGDIELHMPSGRLDMPNRDWRGRSVGYGSPVVFQGADARKILGRGMVRVNVQGASARDLEQALYLLSNAGSAPRYLENIAERGATLGKSRGKPLRYTTLDKREFLALEMALHEESERRALEGELATLEAAWREAEEIAHIADYLPDEPPEA